MNAALPPGNMKRTISYAVAALIVASAAATLAWPGAWWLLLLSLLLGVVIVHDLLQKSHTVLRNYPLLGHFRYLLEDFRHQFRQYLIQADNEGRPFTHQQRATVYQRAKGVPDVLPFGTIGDVYEVGHEWLDHSLAPLAEPAPSPRVDFGAHTCRQPYRASLLNISAMSFGSLSANAVLALNAGARAGEFAHNTGEGGISEYHLEPGGDLVWEIGTGYFGCRHPGGGFDEEAFERNAHRDTVRMIEIKLSQGAKPGGGGILPAAKLTAEIARARGVALGEDVHSPAAHSTFATPLELARFADRLRELSGGKPVGIKLCVGRPEQLLAIVKAMQETGSGPDFITIDGAEGGTGAAPLELSNAVGMPLREALVLARNALAVAGLRGRVKLVASGKVIDGFDMARLMALGADACYAARGMMFALGCIQARRCHSNRCPTGVTTQEPARVHGLVVSDKAPRVTRYHRATLSHLMLLVAATGLSSPAGLTASMLHRRVAPNETRSFAELYPAAGDNAGPRGTGVPGFEQCWERADPRAF